MNDTETDSDINLLPVTLHKDHSDDLTSDQRYAIAAALFLDLPLDSLVDGLLPEEMCPEALAAYVQRCSVLRSSAQTRKAALNRDADGLGREPKAKKAAKKDNVSLAMQLLKDLTKPKA